MRFISAAASLGGRLFGNSGAPLLVRHDCKISGTMPGVVAAVGGPLTDWFGLRPVVGGI